MITDYKKAREDVLKAYESFLCLIEIAKDRKDRAYDPSLVSLQNQAENIKKEKFLLMVVGEAKSGKSTFINAYLGEEILPMDVKQCTSAIVEIRYGEKFVLKATYANDKVETITNKQEIKNFLIANAALDDKYRDIPVSAINIEILMKKKDEKVLEKEIVDFLKGIKNDNIYNLPREEYEAKVREYIKIKKAVWKTIVKKIEIEYPFADTDLKGVVIVDSPGVNADGRLGNVTDEYIEKANAVMFLKSVSGQALESTSFKRFLKSKSADRNKNAMFWILTRRSDLNEADIKDLEEEAHKQCSAINPKQIILLDSKVKLFCNQIQGLDAEQIKEHFDQLKKAGRLDRFVKSAWYDADEDRDRFLQILKELSNFNKVDEALNSFAHKAQYIMLSDFLGRMLSVMNRVVADLEENIVYYKEKAEDPIELENKIKNLNRELEVLTNKINIKVDGVFKEYTETGGLIEQTANKVICEYRDEIDEIDPEDSASVDELQKITFRKIDRFKEFQDELQKEVVAKCDEVLVALSDKSTINYFTIKPDLTEEIFDEIKEEKRYSDEAYEREYYTTGTTFKKTEEKIRFSQKNYYGLVNNAIISKVNKIKNDAIKDLYEFVLGITTAYSNELTRNIKTKQRELDDIVLAKQTAEEIKATIEMLGGLLSQLHRMSVDIEVLKERIENYV